MRKKYLLADVLSYTEVALAIIMAIVAIFVPTDSGVALTIFGIGMLCDAFDGICARRWPYPSDGKYRFWRRPDYVKHLEWSKDIALGAMALLFIILQVDLAAGIIGLMAALVLGSVLQIWADYYWLKGHKEILQVKPDAPDDMKASVARQERARRQALEKAKRIYLKRRLYLYVPAIATIVIMLLYASNWPMWVKMLLTMALVMIELWLLEKKRDRLDDEDVEHLPPPSKLAIGILEVLDLV